METETTNNANLFKRIAAVMAAVRGIPKDGYNEQHKFSYMASDTVLERIGKAMADEELVIIPMLIDYDSIDEKPGNSVRTRTRARFQMHICDSEGNAFIAPWAAEGVDYGNPDRALNKAMTNCIKYFLLKLFIVGAGEGDPDGEGTPVEAKQGKRPSVYRPPVQERRLAPQAVADNLVNLTTPQTVNNYSVNVSAEKVDEDRWTKEDNDLWENAPEVDMSDDEVDRSLYAGIVNNPDIKLGKGVFECIQYLRAQEKASTGVVSRKAYGYLCALLDKEVGEGEKVHGMVMSCILGRTVNHNALPRTGISVLTDWLLEPEKNKTKIGILKSIRDVCLQVKAEAVE